MSRFLERSTGFLVVLLIIAFPIRLAWNLSRSSDEAALKALPDQVEYLELGRSVLRGNELRFFDSRFRQYVCAFRMPGYPVFIAALRANVRAIRIAQAAIDTSTILAIYLLARALSSSRGLVPLLAAALVAFNPYLIYFSSLILTETLFTAMLAWGMALLVQRWKHWWLFGALILAASVLVRPSAVLLPVALGFAAAFMRIPDGAPRWRWSPSAAALLATLLLLVSWAWRNHAVVGKWIWTTTNSGITAYDGFNSNATGASDQAFVASMPQLSEMDEVARSEYLSSLAHAYIRAHPWRSAELAVRKALRTWSPVPLSDQYGDWRYRLAGAVYSVPFFIACLLGLWWGKLPRAAKIFLVLPAVYFTLVHMLSVGSLRYRVPTEAPIAVLAASLFAHEYRRPQGEWKRASD